MIGLEIAEALFLAVTRFFASHEVYAIDETSPTESFSGIMGMY